MALAGDSARSVEFNYSALITDVPADARFVDLWMPVPSDAQHQTVETVKIIRPETGRLTTGETQDGNWLADYVVKGHHSL